jgi:hypothetical protein
MPNVLCCPADEPDSRRNLQNMANTSRTNIRAFSRLRKSQYDVTAFLIVYYSRCRLTNIEVYVPLTVKQEASTVIDRDDP